MANICSRPSAIDNLGTASQEWGSVYGKVISASTELKATKVTTNKTTLAIDGEVTTGGAITATGNITATANIMASGNVTADGNISATGNITAAKVYNAVYNDYAEWFERGEETEAGDIIALSEGNNELYKKATCKDKVIVGVHSEEFAHIIGGNGDGNDEKAFIPIGLVGRSHVKVKGKVEKGDYIVPSDVAGVGVATKTRTHKTIGQAVEASDDDDIKKIRVILGR